MRTRWAWTIGVVVLVLAGCGFIPKPKPPGPPPECPVTCPVGTRCTDPTKGCEAIPPPGPVCQAGEFCNCWHNPTGTEWLEAGCPSGQVCTAARQCESSTPPPPIGCVLAGEPTTPAPTQISTLGSKVNEAMLALRPDCSVGGTCLLGDMTQQEWQASVESKLRELGVCSGQHTLHTDEIAAAVKAANPWEGHHVFVGDDSNGPVPPGGARRTVKWAPASYTGSWLPPGSTLPPVVGACPTPVPPKVGRWGGPKRHLRVNDSTPKFYNREAPVWGGGTITGYCDAQGIHELWCPARVEGDPNRFACERFGVSGKDDGAPLWRSDGKVLLTDNIFQATCDGCTWIEVCAADGTVCSRCEVETTSGLCKE